MIPAVAHFAWIGSAQMPEPYVHSIEEFKALNPNIVVKLWHGFPPGTDAEIQSAFWDAPLMVQKADVLRLAVLQSEGGLYFDLDFAWVQPVSDLLDSPLWISASRITPRINFAMGGPAGHEYWAEWLRRIVEKSQTIDAKLFKRSEYGRVTLNEMWEDGYRPRLLSPKWFSYYQARSNRRRIQALPVPDRLGGYPAGITPYAAHMGGLKPQDCCRHADALLKRIANIENPVGVEVGVFKGRMSAYLLGMRRDLRLTMVDQWRLGSKRYQASGDSAATRAADPRTMQTALAVTAPWGERRTVLHMMSAEAAGQVADVSYDFAFIDDEHTYEGCSESITLWKPKVKPGGWLCGHDYHAPKPFQKMWGVKRAVNEFCASNNLILETDYGDTWFVKIPA